MKPKSGHGSDLPELRERERTFQEYYKSRQRHGKEPRTGGLREVRMSSSN